MHATLRKILTVPRALVVVLMLAGAATPGSAFDLDEVATRARSLARQPWEDPAGKVPEWLLEIDYDRWRDIRFRPERALWKEADSRFTVQMFHPGLFYDRVVGIHVVDAQGVHAVPFSPDSFDYGRNDFASRVPQDLGYAGFRVHYPLNRKDFDDEVIVFLGASYFRALGKGQRFGASARGLAIDTALPSGEEFPWFRDFWIVRPAPDARAITIYALLDSPRTTGAYRFDVYPGKQTRTRVESRLYPRDALGKLGVAPLTSMFFFGEGTARRFDDFRPEVHDSDGLLVAFGGGEWLWRPLDNPRELRVSGFEARDPKGFGLLQRERDFDHHQDLETRAELRPSLWVAPSGGWGAGRVELVEIPTDDEGHDNVVAFWVPETPVETGKELAFTYDLWWFLEDPTRPPGGRSVATRRDKGTFEDGRRFIVDFEGGRLESLPADTIVRGVITLGGGPEIGERLLEQHVVKNPVTGGWRLSFQVRPPEDKPLELRAFLQKGEQALTETWAWRVDP